MTAFVHRVGSWRPPRHVLTSSGNTEGTTWLNLPGIHIHLRSPDPEATAQWFEKMLTCRDHAQHGRARCASMTIGGANVFPAPVKAGDGVIAPPVTPYQGPTISACQ